MLGPAQREAEATEDVWPPLKRLHPEITELCLPVFESGVINMVASSKYLAQFIAASATLETLDLERTAVNVVLLAKGVRGNGSLKRISLGSVNMKNSGVTALADALMEHKTVTHLSLWGVGMSNAGARAIAECLVVNTSIRTLDLFGNQIGREGALALGHSFEYNHTLTDLDIGGNPLGDEGVTEIARGLTSSTSLSVLRMKSVEFGEAAGMEVVGALDGCFLDELQLSGFLVAQRVKTAALENRRQRTEALKTLVLAGSPRLGCESPFQLVVAEPLVMPLIRHFFRLTNICFDK
eukprot:m51a1_g6592 hypothetical protein (295) ;mRNA; f:251432-252894